MNLITTEGIRVVELNKVRLRIKDLWSKCLTCHCPCLAVHKTNTQTHTDTLTHRLLWPSKQISLKSILGNAYKPLTILQERAIRIITKLDHKEQTNAVYKLQTLKFNNQIDHSSELNK